MLHKILDDNIKESYIVINVFFNVLYAFFSALSFVSMIPMLNILFGTTPKITKKPVYEGFSNIENYLTNKINYELNIALDKNPLDALIISIVLILSLFFLKNLFNYLALFFITFLRNGILKDLRNDLYSKILELPIGYFKKRMNNQMQNIRNGFLMVKEYSKRRNFDYDVVVRVRPDNSMFLKLIDISAFNIQPNEIYTTIYPSGHKDPWFFSFSEPDTFDKYCSFIYQKDADETRTDNNFECPELELENYLRQSEMKIYFAPSICLPFYQYDKTQPVTDFPYRQKEQKLIDADGNLVEQK